MTLCSALLQVPQMQGLARTAFYSGSIWQWQHLPQDLQGMQAQLHSSASARKSPNEDHGHCILSSGSICGIRETMVLL